MRLFGGDQVAKLMTVFKLPEDVPLEHPMVSKSIEQAQVKVEGFNFDSRKHLVEYDDVMNKQREIIYQMRRKILESGKNIEETTLKDEILQKIHNEIVNFVGMYSASGLNSEEKEKIVTEFSSIIPFDKNSQEQLLKQLGQQEVVPETTEFLFGIAKNLYEQREKEVGPEIARQIETWVSLSVIDSFWMDHLDAIDDLREGIGLRGYGQRDPLVEYKQEAFNLFEKLIAGIDEEISQRIFKVQVNLAPEQIKEMQQKEEQRLKNAQPQGEPVINNTQPIVNNNSTSDNAKLGRNDPCWCGSGKKWKRCHFPN
jgi:preprotein translocase subunit SecA